MKSERQLEELIRQSIYVHDKDLQNQITKELNKEQATPRVESLYS